MEANFDVKWQNSNSERRYPFNKSSSLISLKGEQMPDSIIADINIWYPSSFGSYIYISAVEVNSNKLSVVLSSPNENHVASLRVTNPRPFKSYEFNYKQAGVSAYIVFGNGLKTESGVWSFADDNNSVLLSRVAKSFDYSGVTGISKFSRDSLLQGNVAILPGTESTIKVTAIPSTASNALTIDGSTVNSVVFELNSDNNNSIFEEFISECEVTPDSDTCRNPIMTTINGVKPDCDGKLYLNITEDSDSDSIEIQVKDNVVTFLTSKSLTEMCSLIKTQAVKRQLFKDGCDDELNSCDPLTDLGLYDGYTRKYGP